MGLFERLFPKAAFERRRYRAALNAMGGYHQGSSRTRRSLRGFAAPSGDADAELSELPTLRERSRDLHRNNPIARGAISTMATNVVGPGLKLQSRIDYEYLGLTDDEADSIETEIEKLWQSWAEYPDADACRRLTFGEIQKLAFVSTLASGDVVALLPLIPRAGTVANLRVQLIEADRLNNSDGKPDDSKLMSGVELGEHGEPKYYHVETTPQGIFNHKRTWAKVAAFGSKSGRQNVIHLFVQDRPGQRRGIPYLAPIIQSLKQLGDYTQYELTAALVQSAFTAFITTESGEDLSIADLAPGVDPTPESQEDGTIEMGPGAVVNLAPGEKVEFGNPTRPSSNFEPFFQAVLKQIGMALEIPYELLVRHFQASYSASRAALLEAWKAFRTWRDWLSKRFCQPIYEEFLADCVASGKINLPGFFDDVRIRRAWCAAEWIGPAPGQVDPVKETQAAKDRIALNASTEAAEAAALNGSDWTKNIRQRAKEETLKKTLGLVPAAPAPGAQNQTQPGGDNVKPPAN